MTSSQALSQQRTRNYISQVKASFIFKALAIALSFLVIPLMIQYLGQEQYGVWSTLLSIMSWVVFFDLGVGNGMRNMVAAALAQERYEQAKSYVSTAYSAIGLLSVGLFGMVLILSGQVPWQKVFNTTSVSESVLWASVALAAFFVLLNFWLGLVAQVLNAVQQSSKIVLGQLGTNLLVLMLVWLLTRTTSASLLALVFIYGAATASTNILLNMWLSKRYGYLTPRLSTPRIDDVKPIISLGVQFFVIQIAVLVIFTTDKMLITQLFGPQYVTQYDVIYKLFSVVMLVQSILLGPIWSAYTDANSRADTDWIRQALKKQLMMQGLVVLAVLFLMVFSKEILRFWVGSHVEVPWALILSMGLFVVISTWNNVFAYFVNGIGQIGAQMFSALIAMFVNIPLAILLTTQFNFGVEGVVLATCASLSLFSVIGPLQTLAILRGRAS